MQKLVKVLGTEILDHTEEHEDDEGLYVQPSEVSVLVEFEYNERIYKLDFQTTNTSDYGAYSSRLYPYDGTTDYDDFAELFDWDGEALELIFEKLRSDGVQKIYNEYIAENYILSHDCFNGMHGDSLVNRAMRKPSSERGSK